MRFLLASFQGAKTHVGRPEGSKEVTFPIRAGTPHGSPVSGSLFAIATVPLPSALSELLGAEAVLFYADDAAVVLRDLEQLGDVKRIFDEYAAASGLQFKAAKCVVLPLRLHDGDMDETVRQYSAAICRIAPQWASFKVASSAVYLGFRLGPGASPAEKWASVVQKYSSRAKAMAASVAPPSTAAQYYKVYILPTLQYTAQLCEASPSVAAAYEVAVQRMLRFPCRALPMRFGAMLPIVGAPEFADPLITSACAMRSAAERLGSEVDAACVVLAKAREEFGTLASLGHGAMPAECRWWADEAIADALARARDADPCDAPALSTAAAARALLPRFRVWFSEEAIDEQLLLRAMTRAMELAQRAAPTFGLAMLRAWCRAWATSFRRGDGAQACRACGRLGADTIDHMVRCPALWRAVQTRSALPPPSSLADALSLCRPASLAGASRTRRARPPAALMRLALASDAYHKLRDDDLAGHPPSPRRRGQRLQAVVRCAFARLWRL